MPMARLYLVPTPIGNMDDITLRAVKVLSSVDVILAEDTRTSQVLLKHLGNREKMWSHHKFNEHAAVEAVAQTIVDGQNMALISDAGTPGYLRSGIPTGAHLHRTRHRRRNIARRRHSFRRWSTAASRATGSVSKASCPPKKGRSNGCNNWRPKNAR